jgi:hypothetical protein
MFIFVILIVDNDSRVIDFVGAYHSQANAQREIEHNLPTLVTGSYVLQETELQS